jgi:hypothetical protein
MPALMKTIVILVLIFGTLGLAHFGVAKWRQMNHDRAEQADRAEYDELVAAIDRDNAEFISLTTPPWTWPRSGVSSTTDPDRRKVIIRRRDARDDRLHHVILVRHPEWISEWNWHRDIQSAYWDTKCRLIAAMSPADQDAAMDEMRRQFIREGK